MCAAVAYLLQLLDRLANQNESHGGGLILRKGAEPVGKSIQFKRGVPGCQSRVSVGKRRRPCFHPGGLQTDGRDAHMVDFRYKVALALPRGAFHSKDRLPATPETYQYFVECLCKVRPEQGLHRGQAVKGVSIVLCADAPR